ncbi:MAG: hypothetical protein ACI9FG_000096 [Crocinitomicaceae bacterium]
MDDNEWILELEYPSKLALDTEFPDGNEFTITLTGGDLDGLSQTVTLTTQAYTNVPYLTDEDLTRIHALDSTSDFPCIGAPLARMPFLSTTT